RAGPAPDRTDRTHPTSVGERSGRLMRIRGTLSVPQIRVGSRPLRRWPGREGDLGGVVVAVLVDPADVDLVAGVMRGQRRRQVVERRDALPRQRDDRVAL